jgi:hypothetical protein
LLLAFAAGLRRGGIGSGAFRGHCCVWLSGCWVCVCVSVLCVCVCCVCVCVMCVCVMLCVCYVCVVCVCVCAYHDAAHTANTTHPTHIAHIAHIAHTAHIAHKTNNKRTRTHARTHKSMLPHTRPRTGHSTTPIQHTPPANNAHHARVCLCVFENTYG